MITIDCNAKDRVQLHSFICCAAKPNPHRLDLYETWDPWQDPSNVDSPKWLYETQVLIHEELLQKRKKKRGLVWDKPTTRKTAKKLLTMPNLIHRFLLLHYQLSFRVNSIFLQEITTVIQIRWPELEQNLQTRWSQGVIRTSCPQKSGNSHLQHGYRLPL